MSTDPEGERTPIFTFDTTHHALWAEQLAQERGFAALIIPAPAEARAKCDLALETLPEELDDLAKVLEEEGVAFRVYSV